GRAWCAARRGVLSWTGQTKKRSSCSRRWLESRGVDQMPYSLRLGQRDFPLPPGRFVIGRSDDCQLCVEDPLASRHHAAVVVDGETLTLEDLGSRNGVFLNHARVSQPEPLKHGDVVKIGSLELT